jgi:hypothetical protein
MIIMLATFVGSTAVRPRTMGIIALVVMVHLGLDAGKERTGAITLGQSRRWPFIVDQALHILVITAAAILISPLRPLAELYAAWSAISDQALVLAFGYTAVVFASGHLNAVLLKPYSDQYNLCGDSGQKQEADAADRIGLARAGMLIGILERFLIMTAVLANSPTGVGLVVAAKSVFRFEAAKKDRRNAEYFLIGTFLSVAEAVIGGVIVRQLLFYLMRGG